MPTRRRAPPTVPSMERWTRTSMVDTGLPILHKSRGRKKSTSTNSVSIVAVATACPLSGVLLSSPVLLLLLGVFIKTDRDKAKIRTRMGTVTLDKNKLIFIVLLIVEEAHGEW